MLAWGSASSIKCGFYRMRAAFISPPKVKTPSVKPSSQGPLKCDSFV